ncbi:MAG: amidophosphoribosyltransferase [Parcubacteria group bacterium Athens0416_74]|nr:MAG: amidophosphoribosyltransferase [Parcubacteria group bacterium Athens0416_74]
MMKSALETILDGFSLLVDSILPPRARTAHVRAISLQDIPLSPTTHDLLGARITTLMDYKERPVQDLVQSLKYDGGGKAAHILASVVGEYLMEEIAGDKTFSTKRILLIPLPLHASRARERGYNQIETVLARLPQEFRDGTHAELSSDVLMRTRATAPQTRLHRSERLSNVAGAFALRNDIDLRGVHIYLIDDVTTTGATLVNAATPLRRAGASVNLIALARA